VLGFAEGEALILPAPIDSPYEDACLERLPAANSQVDVVKPLRTVQPTINYQSGKKLSKQVSFSNLENTQYDVVPYSEVYGDHPREFHFDADGNKVSTAALMQAEWEAQVHSQAQMFDAYSRVAGSQRGYSDYSYDQQFAHDSEPLF
jgi:hypothetical protein